MIFMVLIFVILDTPILGSRMPMRRETLKAIETARDNLMQVRLLLLICNDMDNILLLSNNNLQSFRFHTLIVAQERKQSKMRTLGASNPHNNNKDKHRANTRYLFLAQFCYASFFWPLPGTFFVPKSYPCNFVPGSLGTQWSECSHQEPRAWITRSCPHSGVKAMIPNDLQL